MIQHKELILIQVDYARLAFILGAFIFSKMQLWGFTVCFTLILISLACTLQTSLAIDNETSNPDAQEKLPTEDGEAANPEAQELSDTNKAEEATLQGLTENDQPQVAEDKKKDSAVEQSSSSGKKKKKGRRRNKTRKRKQKTTTPTILLPTTTTTATTKTSTTTTAKPTTATATTPTTTTSTTPTTTTPTPTTPTTTTTQTPTTPTTTTTTTTTCAHVPPLEVKQVDKDNTRPAELTLDNQAPQLPSFDSGPQSRSLVSALVGPSASADNGPKSTTKPLWNSNTGILEPQRTVSNENKIVEESSKSENNAASSPVNFVSVTTFSNPFNGSQGSAFSYETKTDSVPDQTISNAEHSSIGSYAPGSQNSQPAMPVNNFPPGQNSFQFQVGMNAGNQFVPAQNPYVPFNQFSGQNPVPGPWAFQNPQGYGNNINRGVPGNPYVPQGNPYGQPSAENGYSNNMQNPYNPNNNPPNSYVNPPYAPVGGQYPPNRASVGLLDGILNPLLKVNTNVGAMPMYSNRMMNPNMYNPLPYNPGNMPVYGNPSNTGINPASGSPYQDNSRSLGNAPIHNPSRLNPSHIREG